MTAPAGAQAPEGPPAASKPRTLAGRCGAANWVCVSQCIDVSCVERCLARGCEASLAALRQCATKSGCGPDDSACVARACDKQCERTFEPAPPSPAQETVDPCAEASAGAGEVPKKVVGLWRLDAASVKPEEKEQLAGEGQDVKPRPDYDRTLEVTPGGCFLLRTRLEDATLGKGNELEVRTWGTFRVNEKDKTVEVSPKSAQAVGPVCGKPRVIGLSKGRFLQWPAYAYDVEKDTLTLTAKTPSKQTFQFSRQKPEEAPPEEAK
ncbi:hypothetical protein [Archangium sp.]|uniref:hypothetical protein n=1 Tax=Archangium sp. TaxID=1872627 RepID=UPI002ED9EE88